MPFEATRPKLSAQEAHVLGDLFREACGFVLRDDLSFVVERRLAARLEALNLASFAAYARYLRYDAKGPAELDAAIELVMPHETYFFREPMQLDAFATELMPELARRNGSTRRLRVWSAGCSSGEEPYTIAMLLSQLDAVAGWDVDILGTDLSAKALNTARLAEYGPSALRATSDEQRAKFFEPVAGRFRVAAPFREPVRWGRLNLLEADAVAALPQVDVIFCRNVLIYFDAQTRKRVIDLFFDRLAPGGYLLLGHSENLLSVTTRFELVHLERDLVYRRPT